MKHANGTARPKGEHIKSKDRPSKPKTDSVKKTPFKSAKNGPPGKKGGNNPRRNQPGAFVRITPVQLRNTYAEEKRLDRIREQSERKAEKEAKQMQKRKEQKRKLKILSKKNKKGQPVMMGRMQLLLEKIEKKMK